MLDRTPGADKPLRELAEITEATDTREYLARAAVQAKSHDD
jgi:hypothetical protein